MERFEAPSTFTWKLYPYQEDDRTGLEDESGSIIVPAVYEEIKYDEDLPEGTFQVKQNGKMGLISRYNETKIPIEWDSMNFYKFEGYVTLEKNGICGVYQSDEVQAIFEPTKGEYMCLLEKGSNLLEIRSQSNWGIIDFSGKTIVPIEWGYVGSAPMRTCGRFSEQRKAKCKPMASRKGKQNLSEYGTLYFIEGADWALLLDDAESVALVNRDLDILYSTSHSVDFEIYAIEEGENAWLVFRWEELVRPSWLEEGCDEPTVEGCVCIDVDTNQVIWNTVNPK